MTNGSEQTAPAPLTTSTDTRNARSDKTPAAKRRTLLNLKQLIAGALLALYLASVVPSVEIAWVTAILLFTIYLFAFEVTC